jgi:hypothetical protein
LLRKNNMLSKKNYLLSAGLAIVTLSILAPLYVIKKQSSIYPYPVKKNYEYDFRDTNATISYLNLQNGKVSLPKLDNPNQTAFLKVNVSTTFYEKYLLPSIVISAGKISSTEYFEHGAKGIRYLNMTPFLSKETTEINLQSQHISINDQTAELVLFKNQKIKEQKILIIASHPDDAEIAAYGLYNGNKNAYIVTVTAGDAGEDIYRNLYQDKAQDFLKKGELRTWNSITVPLLGGIPIEQSLNLGFFDGTLEAMYKNKSAEISGLYTGISDISTFRKQNISTLSAGLSGKSDWESLVGNFAYLLEKIKPDIIVTPYPAIDAHPDHKFSSIALFEAIKRSDLHSGELYLYSNHFELNEFYPYGKPGGIVSLPPNFSKPLFFNSVYSHTLPIKIQRDKVIVLDSMSDLRPGLEWRTTEGAFNLAFFNLNRDIYGRENSYYKKAIRSNELFFIVKTSDLYDEKKLNMLKGSMH